jgi:hypothetical protein
MISYNSNKSAASGPWTYSSIDRQATLNAATTGATLEAIDMAADSAGVVCQEIKFDVNTDQLITTVNDPSYNNQTVERIATDYFDIRTVNNLSGISIQISSDPVNGFSVFGDSSLSFRLNRDGKILTNQIGPPAVKPTNTGWIPVYNVTGTLKGYLPLFA